MKTQGGIPAGIGGDEREGSTLGAAFFAHKNKKTTLYLLGLSGLAHASGSIT